ncbi:MAG: lamin tail domain-containing protein [Verrucomicrobia bacterium]|nr:lamin tail domain-containing protein [Verrucomicrobiota bacterium]
MKCHQPSRAPLLFSLLSRSSGAAVFGCLALAACLGLSRAAEAANAIPDVEITEFLADNFRGLPDEEGNFNDWIELHNGSSAPVSLNGWYLADSPGKLTKWKFPDVTLNPDAYLIVFASGKNRTDPFSPLHTNFKLSAKSGGYLALVWSDGASVVSAYTNYPVQVQNVSYGFPAQTTVVPLIATNTPALLYVPKDDQLAKTWIDPRFNDAGWTPVSNGLGYETDSAAPFVPPKAIADSVAEYSGTQGGNNWYYGYWDRRNDADGVYAPGEFKAFPRANGPASALNFYTNNVWRWFPPAEAVTEITRTGATATGDNGDALRPSHWAVRRWVSKTNSLVRIAGLIGDATRCGDLSSGDGITGRILVDGVEIFRQSIRQNGMTYSVTTQLAKDALVDFVIDPGSSANDVCDSATFTASITVTIPAMQLVADSMADWSDSGEQGAKNWYYGLYDRAIDQVANYQTNDFSLFPDSFWNGVEWAWLNGNPPYDKIGRQTAHPNGSTSAGGEHWMIRRWVSEVTGTLLVDYHLGKSVSGGGGLTARVFLKGASKDSAGISGANLAGTNRTVTLTGVQAGDPIDFAIDPTGPGSADDAFDEAVFDVRIYGNANLSPYILSDVKSAMQGVNSSAYVRMPFNAASPGLLDTLALRMRYDSGFIAYLNGVEVLLRNAPADATWNAVAMVERPDSEVALYESFDLSGSHGLLQPGNNVLAIHLMNSSAADSDALLQATLTGSYFTTDPSAQRYFGPPTPGAANGFGGTNLGPLVFDVTHKPSTLNPGDDLLVSARVLRSFNDVASVQLVYRVMYAAEVAVPMMDDGKHGDGLAGDGLYGATIPASAYKAGQMVRYFVRAVDVNTNLTRDPVALKKVTPPEKKPEYWGTMVTDPSLHDLVPVFYWFSATPGTGAADNGGSGSIFYNGQFFDNVRFTVHGQSSSGFAKHSWNVDLNSGYQMVWDPSAPSIHDINLMTTYPDKLKMRNMLAYGTYRDAGTAYHFVFPIRVQVNGLFAGDYHFMENGDDKFLERLGLDPNGALYKMYSTFDSPDGEKKTRRADGIADLTEFNVGMGLSGAALFTYMYDNLNIPELVNYLAAMTITGNTDCCHKNYYFYRDTLGSGEWSMFPWDQDLSFGRVWTGGPTYWDSTLHPDTQLQIGGNNRVPSSIFNNDLFNQMYLRRLRTLMDELMQTNGSPAHLLKYERVVDYWTPKLQPLFDPDFAKWGTFSGNSDSGSEHDNTDKQSVEDAANIFKYQYMPARRTYLAAQSVIPKQQPVSPGLLIGAIEYNPASGNQDEEFFTIVNTNKYWVDISHWKIQGAVTMQFQGGTVLPTNSVLYVSPNVRAFRARSVSPHGGQRLFVQGNYQGHLSARGEMIQLVDTAGNIQSNTNYPGAASASQNALRITEIMYHPAPAPAGSIYASDDFEYVELKNIGAAALPFAGVKFLSGITFDFTASPVSSLAAGQAVLIVRNKAAFASRYPAGKTIAGEYTGTLSDNGERIHLADASNETILDFTYNNSWYPVTDGPGFSLVIVDEKAGFDTWGLKESWRPSGAIQGSPGEGDPTPQGIPGVVINEILAHSEISDPVGGDLIELLNPTAENADVSRWYLTDDFATPRKFQIPANTIIAPGGYLAFREKQFGGGAVPFKLGADGDDVYLFSADAAGTLTGYVTGYTFGASLDGVSFGRHTNSVGQIHFTAQKSVTAGTVNSGPAVGPIVISELMYHPLETEEGLQQDRLEYIELRNITDKPVPLFHPEQPTNTWRLTGGVQLDFPTNLTVPANGILMAVNFNPVGNPEALAAFRTAYGTPSQATLIGPYNGSLGNKSEAIALYQPDLAPTNAPAPYVLADWVDYKDSAPWPVLADGFGAALLRKPLTAYGNDPASWIAAKPSPGYEESASAPPTITAQPTSGPSPLVGGDFQLTVGASGDGPVAYQWFLNQLPVPGATQSTLTRQAVRLIQWGNYQAVVMNPAGAVISSNALVIPRQGVVIMRQPVGRSILVGSNATFGVVAVGAGKLRYQWLFNGLKIDGAVNTNYVLKGAVTANEGRYQVRVTDDNGSIDSVGADLLIYDRPQIISQPQPVLVLAGEDATFAVRVSGRAPFGYKWSRQATSRTNELLSPNPFIVFTVRNVSLTLTGNYAVTITNIAGASTSSAPALLTLLLDTDNDRLPDVWENAYGLNPAYPSDASLDSDGDGVSNLDEYRAGTNPRDKESYLKIDRFSKGADLTVVEFYAQSNRTYTVEFRESVSGGVWQTLSNVMVQTTGRVERVVDPYPEASGRIYRLAAPAYVDRPVRSPVILDSPNSVRALKGTPVALSVVASGRGAISYQWLKNGQTIPGATDSRLSFGSIQPGDQGVYSVQVTDETGSVVSQPATLVVLEAPVILEALRSMTAPVDGQASFQVKATGNAPLRYFWTLNGVLIPGATAQTLTVTPVRREDAGSYAVIVRHTTPNGVVSVEAEAELTVQ